jgi:phage-related baseplate assembly protein
MALSLDDLVKPLTADEVLETFLSTLETLGVKARSWRTGGVARTILKVVATSYASYTTVQANFIKSAFLDYAAGDWLTLAAKQIFNVDRRAATFATGKLTLVNNSVSVYTRAAQAVRFRNPTTKKVYTNVAGFTINPGQTLEIDVVAIELGTASNAAPGTIVEFETVLFGVACTNAAAVVASPAESDTDLKVRCRAKQATISVRGPRDAYVYAVTSALRIDGTPVDINRSQISPSSSTGTVTVYVASPAGAPIAGDITAVAESIEAVARPDSVTVSVLAATTVPLARTLTVWARRQNGVSSSDISALVNAALIDAIAAYPIGGLPKPPVTQGYLYADFLAGVVKSAHASIYDVDGTGSDVALNPGEVATLATTITVRVIDA